MVDRPPPSRFSVVERGGRLVVIDSETGQTPLSAAERMALHDRNLGIEPIRPERSMRAPDLSSAARNESGLSARPSPAQQSAALTTNRGGAARRAPASAEQTDRPWGARPASRQTAPSLPPADRTPARMTDRPAPAAAGTRKTIVTGKWWDAKGPRTIELGPKAQQVLTGGFVTLAVVALTAAFITLFIAPVLVFVAAFLLFRFSRQVIGPIGASLVDKALIEPN